MKEDVVRRERAQAAIIDNQAKRLEELDALYKVIRLDIFNCVCGRQVSQQQPWWCAGSLGPPGGSGRFWTGLKRHGW